MIASNEPYGTAGGYLTYKSTSDSTTTSIATPSGFMSFVPTHSASGSPEHWYGATRVIVANTVAFCSATLGWMMPGLIHESFDNRDDTRVGWVIVVRRVLVSLRFARRRYHLKILPIEPMRHAGHLGPAIRVRRRARGRLLFLGPS